MSYGFRYDIYSVRITYPAGWGGGKVGVVFVEVKDQQGLISMSNEAGIIPSQPVNMSSQADNT